MGHALAQHYSHYSCVQSEYYAIFSLKMYRESCTFLVNARCYSDAKVIRRINTRLREIGSINIHRSDAGHGRNMRNVEEEIIRIIEEESRRSISKFNRN